MTSSRTDASMTTDAHPAYRPDIDGLRAIAVMSVIIYHAFPSALRGGFIGVDIFFVISGFLISTIIFKSIDRHSFSFITFYTRRIRRIFPSLLVVLATCFVCGWWILPADEFKQLGKHIAGSAGFIANFVLWDESGYFDVAAETKPLLHLWSLGIEEQFYIVWPLILWFAGKKRWNTFYTMTALAIISFLLNIKEAHLQDDIAKLYYSPQTRFWELWIGAMLAYIQLYQIPLALKPSHLQARIARHTPTMANIQSCLGAGLLLTGLAWITAERAFPGWWALLPTLGAALLIHAGPHAWINKTLLSQRFLVWLGLISFPLYLWHWPLLSFARILASDTPSFAVRGGAVIAAIILATLTKKWIEDPLRFGKPGRTIPLTLITCMLLIGSMGYAVFYTQGVPSRYGIAPLEREPGRVECDNRKRDSGCVFGNLDADKLIVLTGDSHAEHLSKAVEATFGRDYKIHMITNGSCFMGDTMVFPDIGNKKDCTNAINTLASIKGQTIDILIRSQRWHGYGVSTPALIEQAVNDTITMFDLRPTQIIIAGSTADVDLDCEVANYYARAYMPQKTCLRKDDIKAQNHIFIATTQAMSIPDNVHFVYPYPVICPNDNCTVITGNTANYSDTHHLSTAGAMQVMPQILRALAP